MPAISAHTDKLYLTKNILTEGESLTNTGLSRRRVIM
jgi:hypothetical protein